MNCYETYEKAKVNCAMSQRHCLNSTNRLDYFNLEEIESLSIFHDYEDPIPDFSKFPKLRDFSSTRIITMSFLEEQDLSRIERLSITFDASQDVIRFFAPALKDLKIYIHNNDSDQLSLIDLDRHIIDLRGLNKLQCLTLNHCTGYQLIFDEQMPLIEKLVVTDTRYESFSFTEAFPNLKHMVISECKLSNIGFVEKCRKLTYLDLSYNSILNINPILSLENLEYLDLYHNPLENRKKLDSFNVVKKIITDEDKEKQRFLSILSSDANLAYMAVLSARKPVKKSLYMKQIIDRSTDIELFLIYFVRYVNTSIEHYSSQSSVGRRIFFSIEQLKDYAIEEYPFLTEYLCSKDASDVTNGSC